MIGSDVTMGFVSPKFGNAMVRKTVWMDPMKTTVLNTDLRGELSIIPTHQFPQDQIIQIQMEPFLKGRHRSFIATIQRNFNANRQISACPSLGFVMVE